MRTYKIFILDHRSYCLNSIGDSLAQLGHQIFYQSSWDPKEVEAGIAYFKPDILMTVGYNHALFGGFLERLPTLCQKYRLFHIYWATEDMIHHDTWSIQVVQKAKPDYVWTIHPACVEKYEQYGIPASYLNFACNPRLFPAKQKTDQEIYNIAFVGTTHLFTRTYRFDSLQHLLFPLIRANKKTHIWGSGWKKDRAQIKQEFGAIVPNDWLQGHLPYKKSSSIYRSSKIVLGVQNADDQVTQRTFEILGSGACMIASRTSALTELFQDKHEIILTSSPEETLELVDYYLAHPELRHQIGANARAKVLTQHTYQQHLLALWHCVEPLIELRSPISKTATGEYLIEER